MGSFFKDITKDINFKTLASDFVDAANEMAWQASKYYTSSYTKASQKIEFISPLDNVGSCMRKAMNPTKYYNASNPYAEVDIENNDRLSKDNKNVVTTNSVNTPIHNKEWDAINANFVIQDGK